MSECEDCGCRISDGYCVNCQEEVFIAEQYRELGMEVPKSIEEKESQQIYDVRV